MQLKRFISKNNILKSVLLLMSGTVFAQLLNILFTPIITRLYSPSEYGVLTSYIAILGIIGFLGSLQYFSAIPVSDSDTKALNITVLSFTILVINTIVIIFILSFAGNSILYFLNLDALTDYKYLIPLGFFLSNLFLILNSWGYRKKTYTVLTKIQYTRSIVNNGSKVAFSFFLGGSYGLILGQILGQIAGMFPLTKSFLSLIDSKKIHRISTNRIFWSIKRYKNFPLYNGPTILISALSAHLPIIFISTLYGNESVGFYGLAYSISFLPMTLIGKAVQDVFYSEAASFGKYKIKEIKTLSDKFLKILILSSIFPLIIMIFYSPSIFALIFGAEWYDAGFFASILAVYAIAHLVFQPITVLFSIFEKQKIFLYLNLLKISLLILIFIVVYNLTLPIIYFVVFYSFSMAFIETLKYILSRRILKI